jgi:hypothetical protein
LSKTITGTFQDAGGNALAFGTVYLKLIQDAVVSGTGIIAPRTLSFTLDVNGTLGSGVTIYGSDELTPLNIAYAVTASENGGGQVFGPEFYVISGVSPINLNNLTPTSNSPVVFSQAVLQNPTANQTITGFPLILTPSAPLVSQGTLFVQGLGGTTSIVFQGSVSGAVTLTTEAASKSLMANRFRLANGTAYSGADAAIVLSAGWGGTATVSAARGFDGAFSFTVNSSGAGQAANPTITVTFKDGTWTNAPQFLCAKNDIIAPSPTILTWTITATGLVITFNGTPVAANSYNFVVIGMGN